MSSTTFLRITLLAAFSLSFLSGAAAYNLSTQVNDSSPDKVRLSETYCYVFRASFALGNMLAYGEFARNRRIKKQ
jgi:hypothetical protein